MKKMKLFSDYAATHPDAIVTFRDSSMIFAVHSNSLYLSETKSCSRSGGHLFMSGNAANPYKNGYVLTISHIIKTVISSVSEADLGAVYINCHEAVTHRHTLE